MRGHPKKKGQSWLDLQKEAMYIRVRSTTMTKMKNFRAWNTFTSLVRQLGRGSPLEGPHLDSAWWDILCFVSSFLLVSRVFVLSLSFSPFHLCFCKEKIGGIFVADLNSSVSLSCLFFIDYYAHQLFLCDLSTFAFKAFFLRVVHMISIY